MKPDMTCFDSLEQVLDWSILINLFIKNEDKTIS